MQFKDIPGQEKVKAQLIQAVKDQRVSHTQLFLGAEGTGKLAIAIAYAQYINCENPQETDSCGVCPSCVKFNRLAHPDLHFMFPVTSQKAGRKALSSDFYQQWREMLNEQNQIVSQHDWLLKTQSETKQTHIFTDDCNEIIRKLSFKSYEAEYRIVIVWMIEKLYHSAAPKLLKILEEPPEKTLFLLVSENSDKIISTIQSRTQLVHFPTYSTQEIEDYLINEQHINAELARSCAIRSEGNIHRARLMAIDNSTAEKYYQLLVAWMRACFRAKVYEIQKAIVEITKGNREEMRRFLTFSMNMIRDGMLVNQGNDELTYHSGESEAFIKNLAPFIHPAVLPSFYQEIESAIFHIERNGNANIVLTDLSFKISNFLHMPKPQA